jgi:N-glycosylase/DNA lyase
VACLLTSQVSSSSASAAFERLTAAGLLGDERWKRNDLRFLIDLTECLRSTGYRFPNAKAKQLFSMRMALSTAPLVLTLSNLREPSATRRVLVQTVPGIGPKQASMFLRNVGLTFSLAILDTHVLRFLHAIGFLDTPNPSLSSLSNYEKVEAAAIRYADSCEQPVGYLDWAIWITMKAVREMRR